MAHIVWDCLGDVGHYMEPFFGSGAVLLNRPGWAPGVKKSETICDKNGFLANVWRGIKLYPDEVAKWCDWPVNHADLMARRNVLIRNKGCLLENLVNDPEWCDAKLAGYWVWSASCWIGGGITKKNICSQIPDITSKGRGVHGTSKNGSVCQRPSLGNKGEGVHGTSKNVYAWFDELSRRLRHVRVVCGDFTRILGGNWQDSHWDSVGIFFDPPYGVKNRDQDLYDHEHKEDDGKSVTSRVEDWCLERFRKPKYRIVVAGYETEYKRLVESGWTTIRWKTGGGYAKPGTRGYENRNRETLFVSPNCVNQRQLKLF